MFCTNCGHSLSLDDKVCPNCGFINNNFPIKELNIVDIKKDIKVVNNNNNNSVNIFNNNEEYNGNNLKYIGIIFLVVVSFLTVGFLFDGFTKNMMATMNHPLNIKQSVKTDYYNIISDFDITVLSVDKDHLINGEKYTGIKINIKNNSVNSLDTDAYVFFTLMDMEAKEIESSTSVLTNIYILSSDIDYNTTLPSIISSNENVTGYLYFKTSFDNVGSLRIAVPGHYDENSNKLIYFPYYIYLS